MRDREIVRNKEEYKREAERYQQERMIEININTKVTVSIGSCIVDPESTNVSNIISIDPESTNISNIISIDPESTNVSNIITILLLHSVCHARTYVFYWEIFYKVRFIFSKK
jgi:hypothetical protein